MGGLTPSGAFAVELLDLFKPSSNRLPTVVGISTPVYTTGRVALITPGKDCAEDDDGKAEKEQAVDRGRSYISDGFR